MKKQAKRNVHEKSVVVALDHARKDKSLSNEQRLIALFEYKAISTNERVGTFREWELHDMFPRLEMEDLWFKRFVSNGATKLCYLGFEGLFVDNNKQLKQRIGGCVQDFRFNNIVVKRALLDADKDLGNQLIQEYNAWIELRDSQDGDLLAPCFKCYTCKGIASDETIMNNVVMISQKAIEVGRCKDMCDLCETMNIRKGYLGEGSKARYAKLQDLARRQGWWDVLRNGGNSGIIFDYQKQCYKVVFIDYAL